MTSSIVVGKNDLSETMGINISEISQNISQSSQIQTKYNSRACFSKLDNFTFDRAIFRTKLCDPRTQSSIGSRIMQARTVITGLGELVIYFESHIFCISSLQTNLQSMSDYCLLLILSLGALIQTLIKTSKLKPTI